jgi:hypothetical protein
MTDSNVTPLPTYEVPPSIDDEAVVTVRIRLAAADIRDRLAADLIGEVPGRVAEVLRSLIAMVGEDAHLAGVEVALPDFKPYRINPLPEVTP